MYLNPAFQSLEWTERRRPRTEEMNTCYQCRSDPGFLPQQLDIHMRPCIIFRDLISMLPFSCLSFLLSLALTLLSSLFSQFFLLSLLSLRASTRTLRIMESWQRIQFFFFLLPKSVLSLEFIHLFKKKHACPELQLGGILYWGSFPSLAGVYWVCFWYVLNGSKRLFIHLKRGGFKKRHLQFIF